LCCSKDIKTSNNTTLNEEHKEENLAVSNTVKEKGKLPFAKAPGGGSLTMNLNAVCVHNARKWASGSSREQIQAIWASGSSREQVQAIWASGSSREQVQAIWANVSSRKKVQTIRANGSSREQVLATWANGNSREQVEAIWDSGSSR
jgi:hypothetical protein